MKIVFLLAASLLFAVPIHEGRTALICHSWTLVGWKLFGQPYRPSKFPQEESLTLNNDGSYEQLLYGQLHILGSWKFDADSSKLLFSVASVGGKAVQDMPIDKGKATDSIELLTRDSLVIAGLTTVNGVYGHDDKVYVRAQ